VSTGYSIPLLHTLLTSSDEWQSKLQVNQQSLGENKTGSRDENIKFVSADEKLKKRHLFTLHLYSLL